MVLGLKTSFENSNSICDDSWCGKNRFCREKTHSAANAEVMHSVAQCVGSVIQGHSRSLTLITTVSYLTITWWNHYPVEHSTVDTTPADEQMCLL